MSDLQCAATIIFLGDGDADLVATAAALTRRRIGGLWTSPDGAALAAAEVVSAGVGAAARPDARLAPIGVGEQSHAAVSRFADAVWDISDLTRGETSVVITHARILAAAVRNRCRNLPDGLTDEPLGAGETVEVDVDSDGWVCTRWGARAVPK